MGFRISLFISFFFLSSCQPIIKIDKKYFDQKSNNSIREGIFIGLFKDKYENGIKVAYSDTTYVIAYLKNGVYQNSASYKENLNTNELSQEILFAFKYQLETGIYRVYKDTIITFTRRHWAETGPVQRNTYFKIINDSLIKLEKREIGLNGNYVVEYNDLYMRLIDTTLYFPKIEEKVKKWKIKEIK